MHSAHEEHRMTIHSHSKEAVDMSDEPGAVEGADVSDGVSDVEEGICVPRKRPRR